MRNMRKFLRGWARHTTGMLKKEKECMCSIIDELDKLAEVRPLSANENDLKRHSNEQVGRMLREEELKWYQRSKAQFILQGDSNTKYFHNVANGRHRKKCIHSLLQDEGLIEGQDQLKEYTLVQNDTSDTPLWQRQELGDGESRHPPRARTGP